MINLRRLCEPGFIASTTSLHPSNAAPKDVLHGDSTEGVAISLAKKKRDYNVSNERHSFRGPRIELCMRPWTSVDQHREEDATGALGEKEERQKRRGKRSATRSACEARQAGAEMRCECSSKVYVQSLVFSTARGHSRAT